MNHFRKLLNVKSLNHIFYRSIVKGPQLPFHWFGGPSERIKNIILCSGQGSQYVGMFLELSREKKITPKIVDLFKLANGILGYDIVHLCAEGPMSKLEKTIHCQPAVLLANLVGAELMLENKPWIYQKNVHIAGYSLGEIAALVLAKSITAEEAFIIVRARAAAMQRASDIMPSALYFIHGIYMDELTIKLEEIVEEKRKRKPNFPTYAGIAIDCYSRGCVVGATMDCNDEIMSLAQKRVTVTDIPVSGAFHTPMMQPAQEMFRKALDKIEIKMPEYDIYSNVTSEKYTSPDQIKELLVRQLTEPVQWQSIVKKLYKQPLFCRTCELGAGNQLRVLIGKHHRDTLKKYYNYKV